MSYSCKQIFLSEKIFQTDDTEPINTTYIFLNYTMWKYLLNFEYLFKKNLSNWGNKDGATSHAANETLELLQTE